MGVPPKLVIDMQTLAGDSSDNIPGVQGIGPKTASKIVNHFGSWRAAAHAARSLGIAEGTAAKSSPTYKFCHRGKRLGHAKYESLLPLYESLVTLRTDVSLSDETISRMEWDWSGEQEKNFEAFCRDLSFDARGWFAVHPEGRRGNPYAKGAMSRAKRHTRKRASGQKSTVVVGRKGGDERATGKRDRGKKRPVVPSPNFGRPGDSSGPSADVGISDVGSNPSETSEIQFSTESDFMQHHADIFMQPEIIRESLR
jgi:5'-3' exonuclease